MNMDTEVIIAKRILLEIIYILNAVFVVTNIISDVLVYPKMSSVSC